MQDLCYGNDMRHSYWSAGRQVVWKKTGRCGEGSRASGAVLSLFVTLFIMYGLTSPFSTMGIIFNLPIGAQEIVLALWLIIKGFNVSYNE